MTDSIIIGAGAAGLAAARELGRAGKSVIVLEARDRIGGRIHTLHENNFSAVVEGGAEFMHGDLPHTMALMNEAVVKYRKAEGKVWNVKNGDLQEGDFFDDGWEELINALKNLKEDTTIANFLNTQFADSRYDSLRQSIIRFVQGYDAADATKASAFALRDEWTSEGDFSSYHIEGGYGQLMEFIQNDCVNHGVTFHLLSIVKQINWKTGAVEVITEQGTSYTASRVLITIPPAVLKSGAFTFTPAIDTHMNAIHNIETGGVIKFLVELKEPCWHKPEVNELRAMPEMHFIFSDAFIPTWWSQSPSPVPLLTGWLAGPVTQSIQKSEDELMKEVLNVLAYLFACKVRDVETKIRAAKIIDWMQDPFSLGAYAYRTLDTNKAIDLLSKPIEDTIFFAGEAYYSGPEMGTVEAALVSGAHRASLILNAD